MTMTKRPRVAAIGLDDPQVASIEPLCGELRSADSLKSYLQDFSWTETDIVVSSALWGDEVDSTVNLMTIGKVYFGWTNLLPDGFGGDQLSVEPWTNTERELTVSPSCPERYRPLAAELSEQLSRAERPPTIVITSWQDKTVLIETTSGRPVAIRLVLPARSRTSDDKLSASRALLLPGDSNLVAWFRAFLFELHEADSLWVPKVPPRLDQPSDWYTPQERRLADQIIQIESEIERLGYERCQLHAEMATEEENANRGIRQSLWAAGDDLTTAVREMLEDLGFLVRDMDAELKQGEPKHEDLRLTRRGIPEWQAVVEVKGYTSGTRTNDARQIREHRERYIREKGRPPDLSLWISNPYRTREPSSRPAPDQNVKEAAETIGAVHVLVTDLYRQWALVASGSLATETVVESLLKADSGLWTPPALGCDT